MTKIFSGESGGTVRVPRVLVVGVGGAGVRAVAQMYLKDSTLNVLGIDLDGEELNASGLPHILQVGETVTKGLSAGRNEEVGRQAVGSDSGKIRKQFRDVDLLMIVAGLGGGIGTGGVPVVTRVAREEGALVLALVTLPFAFEGDHVSQSADDALKRIRTHSDAIVRISNKLLIQRSDKEIAAEAMFSRSFDVMERAVFSMVRLLTQRGLYGLDFSSIQTMLRNCDGYCHFASARGEGEDRVAVALANVLEHPLLNEGKVLGKSSGVLVNLTGGKDFSLAEVERVMTGIYERLPEKVWVHFGVNIVPEFGNQLEVMMLVAEEWNEPLVEDARKRGELPLEVVGKGQFEKVEPTIYEGQDLDRPTYVRRNIKLPR